MKHSLKRKQTLISACIFIKQVIRRLLSHLLWILMGLFLVLFIQIVLVNYTAGLNAIEFISKGTGQDLLQNQSTEKIPKNIQQNLPLVKPIEKTPIPTQENLPAAKPNQGNDVNALDKAQTKCEQTKEHYREICLQKRELSKLKDDIDSSKLKAIAEKLTSIVKEIDQQSKEEQEPRAKSYALGFLGEAYEKAKQWNESEGLTRSALQIAEGLQDKGLSYQWQWQLGRIYRNWKKTDTKQEEANIKQALAYYGLAVDTLDAIRADLVSIKSDNNFEFFDKIEPVYRDYVSLLLKEYVSLRKSGIDQQDNLKQARRVISSLQSSELASFLGEPCPVNRPEFLDEVVDEKDQSAALLYPIVLEDRIAVILKLPQQKQLYYYDSYTGAFDTDKSFSKILGEFQIALEEAYTFKVVKTLSNQVYEWLIRGSEKYLNEYAQTHSQPIETLVFVLDSPLRNIPMSALYDGKQYLIEKYAVAIAPRLELPNLRPLSKRKLKVLASGLTNPPADSSKQFGKLPYVKDELDAIQQTGVRVKKLLDQDFTFEKFNEQLNLDTFQIVHLATHGQFDKDPANTFILTFGKKVPASDPTATLSGSCEKLTLDCMFRANEERSLAPIELLILNACETASGDARETLGISGISVKAGVRSAIASLWTLNDEFSVEFSRQLYQQLQQPRLSKAEALQKVQQAILKNPRYEHPRYWAPYLLVGNWL